MFKDIDIKFVDKEITPFGGLSLFLKMVERCGFEEVLRECGLPEQGSNRGYRPWQLIMGLFAGVWCGASKFGHLDLVRYDRVLSKMIGWNIGAGAPRIPALPEQVHAGHEPEGFWPAVPLVFQPAGV